MLMLSSASDTSIVLIFTYAEEAIKPQNYRCKEKSRKPGNTGKQHECVGANMPSRSDRKKEIIMSEIH